MAYDNTLKYLVEKYPEEFTRWLLPFKVNNDVQILKTELNLEPVRADSVTFLKTANQILHLEFQTSSTSTPPLPLRMLDYWVRLYRQYNCDIEQVVIFLKPTNSDAVFVNQFHSRNTTHRYRVIRMWEQDPEVLLKSIPLLPLATLARTESPQTLLKQIASEVSIIEEDSIKQSISACTQLLAGLVFEPQLIRQLFRRKDMRESTIYQEILQEGREEGKKSELRLVMRLLNRRIGSVNPQLEPKLQGLSLNQLEDLGEALLDFTSETDLVNWLKIQGI
ncbi:DUF4351 domain-containing protein [Mastigocoleus testarum]|uniref:DUF4351 domain-containing protein n=1 Tax=Mastigocoleus testarum BC008 TaxID=371196 RepID=A0A0V7ZY89_9CYAN|nr:DUF4351 domain-containing protein [Mastigocoleus testarum]KST69238.1 hypothetical protein BC008_03355 [Mastigocoleus testarum BC008]